MIRLKSLVYPIACLLLLTGGNRTLGQSLRRDPDQVTGGLVVSVDPTASRIGAETLHKGGNAVDAAVATAFALAVTWPEAGNLGGGGFMVVRLAGGEAFCVDYRETAPRRATPGMFLDAEGNIDPEKVHIGWLVVGTPGTVQGLWTAHRKAGKLPWRELVQPAIDLAVGGFEVDQVLARRLARQQGIFLKMEEPANVYFHEGRPPAAGSRLKLPELAASLRLIRDSGADGFYRGRTAELIDRAMRSHGGLVRQEDLAAYKAVIREPVRGTYRGHEVIAMPPPSSGGVTLVNMLNLLEGYDLKQMGHNSPEYLHHLAEAMRLAYYDRARYLGDPDFVDMPLEKLTSKAYADARRPAIGAHAGSSRELGADILIPAESEQTTHFSVIDSAGNMVSNTTTLEGSFGAKVIAPGTGFLLNNEMHDFNVQPGVTNETGLIGTPPNLVAPGKRMLSSMSPTLVVRDGRPRLIVGSPGGRTIINTVLQVTLNVIGHDMPIQQAVDAARVHHQWMPDRLTLEQKIPDSTAEALQERSHTIARRRSQGDAHAILIDVDSGAYRPGIDRRIRGAAFGY